jgi:hypothetical protein
MRVEGRKEGGEGEFEEYRYMWLGADRGSKTYLLFILRATTWK